MISVRMANGEMKTFPDGTSPEMIHQVLSQQSLITGFDTSHPPMSQTITRGALDAIPAAGSGIGSIAGAGAGGPVGSVLGSAAGGGTGEAIRQGLLHIPAVAKVANEQPPATLGESLLDIGKQVGWGALTDVGGQAVAAVPRVMGRGFVTSALRPGSQEALDAAVANRVAVGKPILSGMTGTERVESLLKPLGEARMAALDRADKLALDTTIPPVSRGAPAASTGVGRPIQGTIAPHDIGYLASIFKREANARLAINQAAQSHGMDPAELMALVRSPHPDIQDVAAAFERHGLTAQELTQLREFTPTFAEAMGVRAAAKAPQGGEVALLGGPQPGLPPVPGSPGIGIISREDLIRSMRDEIQKAARVPGSNKASKALDKAISVFRDKYPEHMLPSEAQVAKEAFDSEFYRGGKVPNVAAPSNAAMQGFNEQGGNFLRHELSNLPVNGTEIGSLNARMSPLMKLGQDLKDVEPGKPEPFHLGGIHGLDLGLALAGGSPRVASRIGLLATHPTLLQLINQSPRTAAWLLRAASPSDALNPTGGSR